MNIIIDAIIETLVDGMSKEIKSNIVKIVLAIIFILFYLFMIIATMTIGINLLDKSILLAFVFISLSILIFIVFLIKFILIYKKMIKKESSLLSKIFRIVKK